MLTGRLNERLSFDDSESYCFWLILITLSLTNLVAPCLVQADDNWGLPSDGMALSIGFEKDKFAVGEPMIALIKMKNTRDQPIVISESSQVKQLFEVVIVGSHKNIVPTASRNKPDQILSPASSSQIIEMEAGAERRFRIRLDEEYDLIRADTYVVTVSRWLPRFDGAGKTRLISGNAIFTIIDAKKSNDASAKPAASSPSAKAAPSLTSKVPLVTSPNVMGRTATGNAGNTLASPPSTDIPNLGTQSDSAGKPGAAATVARFLAHQDADSAGRWGKIAVLLIFVLIAFLFMRRST